MYREIAHVADLAFEITFRDEEELFNDIADILRSKVEGIFLTEEKVEEYDVKNELEDSIFDIGNEMIYNIDSGWAPISVKFDDGKLQVRYKKVDLASFPVKALTYHMLKVEKEGKNRKVRVVLDV